MAREILLWNSRSLRQSGRISLSNPGGWLWETGIRNCFLNPSRCSQWTKKFLNFSTPMVVWRTPGRRWLTFQHPFFKGSWGIARIHFRCPLMRNSMRSFKLSLTISLLLRRLRLMPPSPWKKWMGQLPSWLTTDVLVLMGPRMNSVRPTGLVCGWPFGPQLS